MIQWYSEFDSGHIAWVLMGAVVGLILLGPGLIVFYAGLFGRDRPGDLVSRWLAAQVALTCVWCLWGYSLAFAPSRGTVPPLDDQVVPPDVSELPPTFPTAEDRRDPSEDMGHGGVVGGNEYLSLRELSPQPGNGQPVFPVRRPAYHLPHAAFLLLQLSLFLVAISPLLVVLSEHLRIGEFLAWGTIWGTVVYAPLTHWLRGDGWLSDLGALDAAGGLWHVGVGFSGLACALVPRRIVGDGQAPGTSTNVVPLANIPATGIGVAVVWAATLGVHGALLLQADGRAVMAVLNSHLAATAGVVGWFGAGALAGRPDRAPVSGAGAIAGLAAIAPGCALMVPQSSVIVGLAAGAIASMTFRPGRHNTLIHRGLSLFTLQGVPAGVGLLLAGLFATSSVAGSDRHGGLIEGYWGGDPQRIVFQFIAIGSVAGLSVCGTWFSLAVVRIGSTLASRYWQHTSERPDTRSR